MTEVREERSVPERHLRNKSLVTRLLRTSALGLVVELIIHSYQSWQQMFNVIFPYCVRGNSCRWVSADCKQSVCKTLVRLDGA